MPVSDLAQHFAERPPGGGAIPDPEFWAFTAFLLSKWRLLAAACGIAAASVLGISLLLPPKYTAVASVLIEPPAGNDPRGSTAVSPVYLESLKTYEHFALSDSLFERAMASLGLHDIYPGVPIEVVKRRILEVSKPRDTKVLQIKATLHDPEKARDLARYVAQQTVQMNHSLGQSSASELTEGGDGVLAAAKKRLDDATAARTAALAEEPVAELETDVAAANELKGYVARQLVSTETEAAAYESRTGGKQGPAYMDSESAREAAAATRAEVQSLSTRIRTLDSKLAADLRELERRKHHRDLLDKELLTAQQQFETAVNHKNEVLESISFRGERLEIIDPGVVPQKPSSPNIPLNVAVAIGVALVSSLVYSALLFAQERRRIWAYRETD